MPSLQPKDKFANRYLLKKLIGVGGFSQVWLAQDSKSSNLEVAIKIFAPGQGMDEKGLELFSKEYSLVFNLNHPGLLKPTYFDDFEGSPYLVMQYCNQGSVFGKIGEVTDKELALFMQQASSALKYLHNQNPPIIHQDIKPDNFLIDSDGNYLLTDFGISSKIRRTLTKSMGAHAATGTLAYMPPEKFSADKQIIKAGDIFSLGVTMYELLTGDLPFGDNGGLTLKAGADVPNLPGNFSPELNCLLRNCMAKEPWERPMAEQLEETASSFLQTGRWVTVGKDVPETDRESHKEPQQPIIGRTTEPIPQRQPEPKTPIALQIHPDKKRNFIPEIILGALVVVIGIVAIFMNIGPTAKQMEETRIADSIQIADSIAMVMAEQQRIADSIANVQQNSTTDGVEKQPHIGDNTTAVQNDRLNIGDLYAGGIIFYLDGTGEHGKVCAAKDQSKNATWEQAKSICSYLNLNGYNDWYLPSKDELNKMYENLHKNRLGHFANDYYVSSSEIYSNNEWTQNFYSGEQEYYLKTNPSYVRAVRVF